MAGIISAGIQTSRQGIPQPIPDFMTLDQHLATAQYILHHFGLPPSVHPAIEKNLRELEGDEASLMRQKDHVLAFCERQLKLLEVENEAILRRLHLRVVKVLRSGGFIKQVALMRELAFASIASDLQAVLA